MSAIHELRLLVDEIQAPHRREANLFYNKYRFKQFLHEHGVRVPETYFYFTDPEANLEPMRELESFVLKPNSASSGADVYCLTKIAPGQYREIDGRVHPWEFVQGKCRQIMSIKRSGGVLIEEVIESSPEASNFVSKGITGLLDYRCFTLDNRILYSKLRLPRARSENYSNVHRGATPLFVSKDGYIVKDNVFRNTTTVYEGIDLDGVRVPYWDKLRDEVVRIASIFKLPFHSIDICPIKSDEYVVIESEAIPYLGFLYEDSALDLASKIREVRTDPA